MKLLPGLSMLLLHFSCALALGDEPGTEDTPQSTTADQAPDEPLRQVGRLMATDRVDEAVTLLQKTLKAYPKDARVRFNLARVLAYDGRQDEAIKLLTEALSAEPDKIAKFNMAILAGELSLQRADDGITITRERGTITARPPEPDDDNEAFVKKYTTIAEAVFREALKIAPEDPRVLQSLAKTLTLAGKSNEALKLWGEQLKRNPTNQEATLQLAKLQLESGQSEAAVKLLKDALELTPNNSAFTGLLLEHYEATKNEEKINYWKPRHRFSQTVPSFVTLKYSQENVDRIAAMAQPETVEALLKEKTPSSSELLAIYCYSHPHNELEDRSYVELGDRGATELLWGLMRNAQSTCTIRGAASQLARSKPEELYAPLIRMLPGDRRTFGMHMDIANALDVLQDPRCVPSLIMVLAPEDRKRSNQTPGLEDLIGARHRAALALGGFKTKEAEQALELGLKNPLVSLACAAALYRMKGEPVYLKTIEKAVDQGEYRAWPILARLTEKLPKDESLKKLQKQLEKRLREEE